MRLFLIAAVVCFIFAIIASLETKGLFLSAGDVTWIAGGFLALTLDFATGYRFSTGAAPVA